MKQLIEKVFGWMKESNRPAHMKAGLRLSGFCYFIP